MSEHGGLDQTPQGNTFWAGEQGQVTGITWQEWPSDQLNYLVTIPAKGLMSHPQTQLKDVLAIRESSHDTESHSTQNKERGQLLMAPASRAEKPPPLW